MAALRFANGSQRVIKFRLVILLQEPRRSHGNDGAKGDFRHLGNLPRHRRAIAAFYRLVVAGGKWRNAIIGILVAARLYCDRLHLAKALLATCHGLALVLCFRLVVVDNHR